MDLVQLEKSLEDLEKNLINSHESSLNLIRIVDSIQQKFEEQEKIVKPVQKSVSRFTHIKHQLDSVIERIEVIQSNIHAHEEVREVLLDPSPLRYVAKDGYKAKEKLDLYLQSTIRLSEGLDFLLNEGVGGNQDSNERSSSIRISSGSDIEKLSNLKSRAVHELLNEFKRRLDAFAPGPSSYLFSSVSSTLKAKNEKTIAGLNNKMTNDIKETMKKISACLYECGDMGREKLDMLFIKHRSGVLLETLRKGVAKLMEGGKKENDSPFFASNKIVSASSPPTSPNSGLRARSKTTIGSGKNTDKTTVLTKGGGGGHVVYLLNILIQGMIGERALADDVLPPTCLCFFPMMVQPLHYFTSLDALDHTSKAFKTIAQSASFVSINEHGTSSLLSSSAKKKFKSAFARNVFLFAHVVDWLNKENSVVQHVLTPDETVVRLRMGLSEDDRVEGRRNMKQGGNITRSFSVTPHQQQLYRPSSESNSLHNRVKRALSHHHPSTAVSSTSHHRSPDKEVDRELNLLCKALIQWDTFTAKWIRTAQHQLVQAVVDELSHPRYATMPSTSSKTKARNKIFQVNSRGSITSTRDKVKHIMESSTRLRNHTRHLTSTTTTKHSKNGMVHPMASLILNYIRRICEEPYLIAPLCAPFLENEEKNTQASSKGAHQDRVKEKNEMERKAMLAFVRYVHYILALLDNHIETQAKQLLHHHRPSFHHQKGLTSSSTTISASSGSGGGKKQQSLILYTFLMNYHDYIFQGIRTIPLFHSFQNKMEDGLGMQQELHARQLALQQLKRKYVDLSTASVFSILSLGGPKVEYASASGSSSANISRTSSNGVGTKVGISTTGATILTIKSCKAIKEFFNHMNRWVEDMQLIQPHLAIPNPQLRTELRLEVRKRIIPPYERIYAKLSQVSFSKKQMQKYMKYPPELVSTMISQIFQNSDITCAGNHIVFNEDHGHGVMYPSSFLLDSHTPPPSRRFSAV